MADLQLDGAQSRNDTCQLGGSRPLREAHHLFPGSRGIDDQPRELDVREVVRLAGARRVDPMASYVGIDDVETIGRYAVQFYDAAPFVHLDGGLGIVHTVECDEPGIVVLLGESVEVDRPLVEPGETPEDRGESSSPLGRRRLLWPN